jgi:hypothetical protein
VQSACQWVKKCGYVVFVVMQRALWCALANFDTADFCKYAVICWVFANKVDDLRVIHDE